MNLKHRYSAQHRGANLPIIAVVAVVRDCEFFLSRGCRRNDLVCRDLEHDVLWRRPALLPRKVRFSMWVISKRFSASGNIEVTTKGLGGAGEKYRR